MHLTAAILRRAPYLDRRIPVSRHCSRFLPVLVLAAACAGPDSIPTAINGANLASTTGGVAQVSSAADAGPGSLRAAIAAANADPAIGRIEIRPGLGVVSLATPIHYSGAQPLAIDGKGLVLDGTALAAGEPAFLADGGGDLDLSRLTVRNAPGTGLTVAVPSGAAGIQRLLLSDFAAEDNGSHGILVNDQADYFSDEFSSSTDGSPASVEVSLRRTRVTGNGFASIDRDGIRLNEGGLGDLLVTMHHVLVAHNGGDGIELDERTSGSVHFDISHTEILENGNFDLVTDPDDGMDVDEQGDGDIIGRMVHVDGSRNYEQGIEFNENDAGDLRVDLLHVTANDNWEEGIEYEEDDDIAGGGHIVATIRHVTTLRNGSADGDAGLKLREKGEGDLHAVLEQVVASDNLVGGIFLREDAAGSLTGSIAQALTERNDGDGIEFDENGSGDLAGAVRQSTSRDNDDAGVDADQASSGTGTLLVFKLTGGGNGDGDVELGGTTLIP